MDKNEAKTIATKEIRSLKQKPYSYYQSWIIKKRDILKEVKGLSGVKYQVSRQAFYDDKKFKTIRVMVNIDDGSGLSSFVPLTEDFIIAPDGSFVGE